ncbi:FAD-dependent oxidoreductase [Bacillus sp. FJAT-47783]|uniref:NAD(P)/FAD-dependent oxidoreductase n=1 Tax=Bacillus sp. FJAT-47783 TaxID=2922712 RepID=UPI001FAE0C58|nr:FAD-dependent oxidoreductase [Bacillus sp. FJAT-47783]
MDLQSGKFYWQTTFPHPPSYPKLEENIECDVLIVGAGASGAQCAYFLAESGLDIVMVDKRKASTGSTSTNTALIQYLGEKMLHELVGSFGEENAVRHFQLCEKAIDDIETASSILPINSEFTRRDSLYYASERDHVSKLEKEYQLLKKHGFHVEYWSEKDIEQNYPFQKHAALYFKNDGELNPMKFTYGLLEYVKKKGVQVYEETEVTGKKFEKDYAIFFTKGNYSIKAKHIIIAAGYEGLEFKNEKNAFYGSSYAAVTNPVKDFSSWHNRTLIWETARPYVYMRTTADNRIIIGGLDDTTSYAKDRDSKIIAKKDMLIEEFNKLFPDIHVTPEYYLGAFYGTTHDGLPIIGLYENHPNCYYLFGFGDNGTVYSMVLAKIIRDLITGEPNPNVDLYLQNRPAKR